MSDDRGIENHLQAVLGERVAKAAQSIQRVSENVGRTIASTREMLADRELRRKGAAFIVQEASKGFKDIQQRVGTAADTIGKNIQQGVGTIQWGLKHAPKQLQNVMERVQKRVREARFANLLEVHRNIPVDIQMGSQLFEDAPQEFRTRLWSVLLDWPDLSKPFRPLCKMRDKVEGKSTPTFSENHKYLMDEETRLSDVDPFTPIGMSENSMAAHLNLIDAWPSENSFTEIDWKEIGQTERVPSPDKPDELFTDIIKEPSMEVALRSGDENWEIIERSQATKNKSKDGKEFNVLTPHSPEVQSLLAAMLDITWPLERTYDPESRYGILIEITIGQDEVDEIIFRDIHRTFPEHPHFNFEQGQKALFNVLKAYSLHDLEVGYCQGMAFIAGILLLYLPEERAFRAFCQLMDKEGMNLRRLYLPGLGDLKAELWKFEWLLQRHLPILNVHLQNHGIPPVLYASQWFLTLFACPFTIDFISRMLDIMFLEASDNCMIRAGFAVLAEMGDEILVMDDFEDILTHIKVRPTTWEPYINRRVLNSALLSPITDADLREAQEAFSQVDANQLDAVVSGATPAGGGRGVDLIDFDKESPIGKNEDNELGALLSMDLLLDIE